MALLNTVLMTAMMVAAAAAAATTMLMMRMSGSRGDDAATVGRLIGRTGGPSTGRPAFIPYVTAGLPTPDAFPDVLLALQHGGADIIEVGVPFSDPSADGPTIAQANDRALALGVCGVDRVLALVRRGRELGVRVPLVLMSYVNPLLAYGSHARLADDATAAGIAGLIVVDLPPDGAATELRAACRAAGIALIPLAAPTATDERLRAIGAAAELTGAFVYCLARLGVTGEQRELSDELAPFMARMRRLTGCPLAVGFGLSTREHFARAGQLADAVVIGSAIVRLLLEQPPDACTDRVLAFCRDVVPCASDAAYSAVCAACSEAASGPATGGSVAVDGAGDAGDACATVDTAVAVTTPAVAAVTATTATSTTTTAAAVNDNRDGGSNNSSSNSNSSSSTKTAHRDGDGRLATDSVAVAAPVSVTDAPAAAHPAAVPDAHAAPVSTGYFGTFGGRFVSETLQSALDELTRAYEEARVARTARTHVVRVADASARIARRPHRARLSGPTSSRTIRTWDDRRVCTRPIG